MKPLRKKQKNSSRVLQRESNRCALLRHLSKYEKYVHGSSYATGVMALDSKGTNSTHRFRLIAEFSWLSSDPPDNPEVSRVEEVLDLKFMSNDDDLR